MAKQLKDIKLTDIVALNTDTTLTNSFEGLSANIGDYPSVVSYVDEQLQTITYNLGSGLEIVKTFNYTDGKLTSIVYSGDIPEGINTTKTFNYVDGKLTNSTYS